VAQRILRLITARQVDFNSRAAYILQVLNDHAGEVNAALGQIAEELQTLPEKMTEVEQILKEGEQHVRAVEESMEELRASQRRMLRALQEEIRRLPLSPAAPSSRLADDAASSSAPSGGEIAARTDAAREATERNTPEDLKTDLLDDAAYNLYEDAWRGSVKSVGAAQDEYVEILLPYLDFLPAKHRIVLDVGFGRGELLQALANKGIRVIGVDINRVSVAAAREAGLQVEQADANTFLAAQSDNTLGAIVALQVLEHFTSPALRAFLDLAYSKLAPGGVALLETLNPGAFASYRWFFMDLSHKCFLPPETLRFACECAGFGHVETRMVHPVADYERLRETGDDAERENVRRLNAVLFGPQDYFILVRKSSRVETREDGPVRPQGPSGPA
jgi:O-antigen chain-terminating methyltransferase